jgi:serine protease
MIAHSTMSAPRRHLALVLRIAAVLSAALTVLPLCAQTTATDEAPAHGLIVRLKQPVAHIPNPRTRDAGPESARWRRVLGEAGLSGASGRREPRVRPVGRDQQLVEFERPLSRGEAVQIADKLRQRPDVEWVEPNLRQRRLQATAPSDPLFAQQWWLQPVSGGNANLLDARRRGVAGFQTAWLRANMAPVVVAVLDTGITAHEDLVRVLPGYDFVREAVYASDGGGRDADPADPGDYVTQADLADPLLAGCIVENSSWHGTIVAGMLAASWNNGGVAGMHSGLSVLPVRVAGKCGADVPDIVDGMRWAAGLPVAGAPPNPNPARIVNISFGGSAACGPAYQTAVDELRAVGVLVVAAAGNEATTPSRPASCRGVIGVVGLNRDGFKTNYSNFGSELAATGLAAPAGDDPQGAWAALADSGLITLTNLGSTVPGRSGYARLYGTSFSAPQVAGVMAHMLSLNPALSAEQILTGLRLSARPHVISPKIGACSAENPGRCICSTDTCGAGILDADQALAFAHMPEAYVPPVRQPAVIDNADIDAALQVASQDRPANVVVIESSGSGGGAFGAFWLMALFTAAVALHALGPTRTPGIKGRA